MKKTLVLFIVLLVSGGYVLAQGELDALRLSRNDLQGTARGQAMGGAFGALGGDVTGISINPAGLGVYSSSEVSATLGLANATNKTKWKRIETKDDKFNVNIENLSYVTSLRTGSLSMPVINFAFSYNRLKNFNNKYNASAQYLGSSLTDYIALTTNRLNNGSGISSDQLKTYGNGTPWLSTLGYNGYFINPIGNNKYESPLLQGDEVDPILGVSEKGGIDNFDFSLATNFDDQFYLGVDFSVTDIYYKANTNYTEYFYEPESMQDFGYIGLDNFFETEGSGYQFKVGAIWRPVPELRLGVAYHSPTWYHLTDYYRGWAEADYAGMLDGSDIKYAETPSDGATDYRFHTPYSWTFSVASVLGTSAILSLDYEIKDYRSMNLSNVYGEGYRDDNKYIDDDFKVASTLRAGFEYRITPQFSARVGYAWMQNPYEQTFKDGQKEPGIVGTVPNFVIEGDTHHLTYGLGYKFTPKFYVDLAFVYKYQKNDLYAFPSVWDDDGKLLAASQPASLNNTTYKSLLTLGYKF
ncbi:MAG: outer membrane protein transport protein [Candidatus Symbiothrix sp.]|jgi:hypothetical protein|nr:outer membrane protein transport protein [Candidatus Symbiothrix sp.]